MEVLQGSGWSMLRNACIFAATVNVSSTSSGKGRASANGFGCKAMSTFTSTASGNKQYAPLTVPPPAHPTYDLKAIIKLALAEDLGDKGDISCLATIPIQREAEAHFLAKEDGVLAGIAMADMVFEEVDPLLKVEWNQKDGSPVKRGSQFGSVHGSARSIVVAERVVLNFMQRMSGIATLTKAMAEAAKPARILETRKTAPALRLVDKWVQIGGGENHRMGLFDMVMLKDNHISIAGGIINAIASVEQYLKQNNLQVPVEVETRTLEEVREVMSYTAQGRSVVTRIMLDNMIVPLPNGDVDVSMLKEAIQLINGRFETEHVHNRYEVVHFQPVCFILHAMVQIHHRYFVPYAVVGILYNYSRVVHAVHRLLVMLLLTLLGKLEQLELHLFPVGP